MKLGKLPPKKDPRTLKLANYLNLAALPPLQTAVNWSDAVSAAWGMMDNDQIGDCTCAGLGHIVMAVTANTDGIVIPSDDEVLAMYEEVGGYQPGNPATDQGATELDALNFMRNVGLSGVKVDAFADVDQSKLDEVKMTVQLFGAAYIGVQILQADMDNFQSGKPWDVGANDGAALGGHAIPIVDFDANGGNCVTWGQLQPFTWAWFAARCDEVHAPLFFKWISDLGTSPSGLNLPQLESDVQAVAE
ncbi:MAG TPA: hypothetical protein VMD75_09680 [Candidatus Binataceae bacterium]|nr:hypothetical protein [Candidatus Binataceae bacterium]